ncbi:hypothetical protein SUGI_0790560 [Cryptomeria japonica]|nr:hypothetical protein SUGI_0790560 [Cryptomeria japonica]
MGVEDNGHRSKRFHASQGEKGDMVHQPNWIDIDDCVDKDYEQNNVKPLHIFVIDSKESEQKKGCVLPRSKMANSNVGRIVNSDEVQSVVRPI